ncbi:unnamed protein product [Adineta ricciae]|uniref:Uncharacterized protein n=1 Tax=Adineta ricciae TaxID=249248 RepID=A0A813ST41_ADIRI|nr:unnamed protein product [Adineta ricciae]CAF0826859.1 unnamed protein product [Adineta ricciae]
MYKVYRQLKITIIIILIVILFFGIFYDQLVSVRRRTFLVTIVDYRWNALANVSVQLNTADDYHAESYTNKYGQTMFYINTNIRNNDSIQIAVADISENVLPVDKEIVIRLDTINRDTDETYGQELVDQLEPS